MRLRIFIFIIGLIFSSSSFSQRKPSNKFAGNYIIRTGPDGIIDGTDSSIVSVKIYDLSIPGSCKRTEGRIKIGRKTYLVSDNEATNPIDYFSIALPEGAYKLIFKRRGYYKVKTRVIVIRRESTYDFSFFVLNKDAIER